MSKSSAFHENYSHGDDVKVGSERSFGLVFAAVFALVALWPLFVHANEEGTLRFWALCVAGFFAITALTMPSFLAPLNRLWFRFGLLLHKIVNPLVMGFLFFLTVTPIAMLMRIFSKRPLDLRFKDEATSYWIDRTPPGPSPESMKKQF